MGVFGAIATWLAGCTTPTWSPVAEIPSTVVPARVLPGEAILVFGYDGADGQATPVGARRAEVWRIEGGQAARVLDAPGWFVDADARGDRVVALRATPTEQSGVSRYLLHVSEDRGQSWTDGAEVPATGLVHVRLASDDAAWVHGVGVVMLSRDAGVSWTRSHPPGTLAGVAEAFDADGSNVWIGGKLLRRSTDWGVTWTRAAPAVDGTDGRFVVGGQQVGRLDGAEVAWTSELPERLQIDTVASEGDAVRISGFPLDAPGSVVKVYESEDGGRSFAEVKARGDGQTGRVGLAADGVVHVDLSGSVRVHR